MPEIIEIWSHRLCIGEGQSNTHQVLSSQRPNPRMSVHPTGDSILTQGTQRRFLSQSLRKYRVWDLWNEPEDETGAIFLNYRYNSKPT